MGRFMGVKKADIFMETAGINKKIGCWGRVWLGGEAPGAGNAALTDERHYAKGGRGLVMSFKQEMANNFSVSAHTQK